MAVSNSLVAQNGTRKLGIAEYMGRADVQAQISRVVGKHAEGFITSIVSAVQVNSQLQECTKQSILSAALLGEGLKLSPSPQLGHFYMVPFKNNKQKDANGNPTMEAQFILSYKGYLQLAIRSGQYKKINVISIKEGELVRYDPLNEEIEVNLIEDEVERENANTIGYYAFFEYMNGFRKALYWSKGKMLAHADRYSNAFSKNAYEKLLAGQIPEKDMWKFSSFWYKDFDGMAQKTMIRQLISKWGIMSVEMQKAYEADMAVIREDGTPDYVDNVIEVARDNNVSENFQTTIENDSGMVDNMNVNSQITAEDVAAGLFN